MPLGPFLPYMPWFLPDPTKLTNTNPLLSKAEWCKYCIHPRILNFNHFKMVDIALKIIATRSTPMESLAYQKS
jgi:hypothetical protein